MEINRQVNEEYQEFAARGTYKELLCKGRPCVRCHKCRDWHFGGDQNTWDWICNYENWRDADWQRWDNGVWKRFTKRNGAKCRSDYISSSSGSYAIAAGGGLSYCDAGYTFVAAADIGYSGSA
ncbi:unnamed protein product, partial [Rotaria sordida]